MDGLVGEYGHLAGDPLNGYYMSDFLQELKVFQIKITFWKSIGSNILFGFICF